MVFGRTGRKAGWQSIDIHCHVLPGLDDGAGDMAEALAMLRIAAKEGISDMIATPHYRAGRFTASPEEAMERLWRVQEAADAEQIPVRLHPGSEIYWSQDMLPRLRRGRLSTLGASDSVLVEFSPSVLFQTLQNAMDRIMAAGFRPILAHAERYECLLKDAEGAFLLHDMGAGIQVNASTVTGKNGAAAKKFAHRLLKEGAVDYIGTDAHGAAHRRPEMAKCRAVILKKYGEACAYQILRGSAERLLKTENEGMESLE